MTSGEQLQSDWSLGGVTASFLHLLSREQLPGSLWESRGTTAVFALYHHHFQRAQRLRSHREVEGTLPCAVTAVLAGTSIFLPERLGCKQESEWQRKIKENPPQHKPLAAARPAGLCPGSQSLVARARLFLGRIGSASPQLALVAQGRLVSASAGEDGPEEWLEWPCSCTH